MKQQAWIVLANDEGHEERVDAFDRRVLAERGFVEYRVLCDSGPRKGESVYVFVERWPGDFSAVQLMRAASHVLDGCSSLQAFRSDGSAVLH
jgi:quinol monooxygenase YgiN